MSVRGEVSWSSIDDGVVGGRGGRTAQAGSPLRF